MRLILLALILLSNYIGSSEGTRPNKIDAHLIILREVLRFRVSKGEFYIRKLIQSDEITRVSPGGPDPQHH